MFLILKRNWFDWKIMQTYFTQEFVTFLSLLHLHCGGRAVGMLQTSALSHLPVCFPYQLNHQSQSIQRCFVVLLCPTVALKCSYKDFWRPCNIPIGLWETSKNTYHSKKKWYFLMALLVTPQLPKAGPHLWLNSGTWKTTQIFHMIS